jgi:hypothetical protein
VICGLISRGCGDAEEIQEIKGRVVLEADSLPRTATGTSFNRRAIISKTALTPFRHLPHLLLIPTSP